MPICYGKLIQDKPKVIISKISSSNSMILSYHPSSPLYFFSSLLQNFELHLLLVSSSSVTNNQTFYQNS